MRFFDTTFLGDLLSADPHAVERARTLRESGELLATASPCVAEVMRGAQRVGGLAAAEAKALIEQLEVVPLNTESALRAGQVAATVQDGGGAVPLIDCLIARVVVESGGILLSRDTDFSRVPGPVFEPY